MNILNLTFVGIFISMISLGLNHSNDVESHGVAQVLPTEIHLNPGMWEYRISDYGQGFTEITGYFYNRGFQPIYIVRPSSAPQSNIQKWVDGQWQRINFGRRGTLSASVVTFGSISEGSRYTIRFPLDRLIESGEPFEGKYRFVITLSPTRDSENVTTIYSPEFYIRYE